MLLHFMDKETWVPERCRGLSRSPEPEPVGGRAGSAPGGGLQIQSLCSPPSLPLILPALPAQGPSKCFAGLPRPWRWAHWKGLEWQVRCGSSGRAQTLNFSCSHR